MRVSAELVWVFNLSRGSSGLGSCGDRACGCSCCEEARVCVFVPSAAGRVCWTSSVMGEGPTVAGAGAGVRMEELRVAGETKELEAASNCKGAPGGVDTDVRSAEVVRGAARCAVCDEVSGGLNAGSGFVTCEGEAPALRLDGGIGVPSLRVAAEAVATAAATAAASPVVKESLSFSLSLSLLPTDFAR